MLASTEGPFLSDDGGVSFTRRVTGIHASRVSDFAAADDGTLYASFETGSFGIFRRGSSDWTPLNNTALRAAVNTPQLRELATAAMDSNLIYSVAAGSQVLRSDDGGNSWAEITNAWTVNGHPQDVAVDPSNPDIAYVGTYSEGLWRTANRGVSWNRLAGGVPDRIDVIAVDPANTQRLYILTTEANQGLYK